MARVTHLTVHPGGAEGVPHEPAVEDLDAAYRAAADALHVLQDALPTTDPLMQGIDILRDRLASRIERAGRSRAGSHPRV